MGVQDKDAWEKGAIQGWYGVFQDAAKNTCRCAFCRGDSYHCYVPRQEVTLNLPPSLNRGSEIPEGFGIYRVGLSLYYLRAGCHGSWLPGDPEPIPTLPHLRGTGSVAPATGMSCKSCRLPNEYASANQADGSYLCYNCR